MLNAPRGMGLDITGNKIVRFNSGNNTVMQADLPNGANPVLLNGGQPRHAKRSGRRGRLPAP